MAFGLDISDLKLRLVVLDSKKDLPQIEAASEIDLPSGLIVEGEIIDPDKTKEYLKKLLQAVKPKQRLPKEVIACLPERKSFIKVIKIKEEEVNQKAILEELKHHLPYQLDEVYFDWQDLKTGQCLVGASPRNTVDSYIALLSAGGLFPVVLEIESQAIARSLLPRSLSSSAPLIIADIGRARSTFILYDKNTIYFTSSTKKFCGDVLTGRIKEKLAVSEKEAETLKQKVGYDRRNWNGKIEQALTPALDELVQIIKEIAQFYQSHYQNTNPLSQILIGGGGAKTPGLAAVISENLGVDCKVAIPQVKIRGKASEYVNKQTIYSYATAIGLAMRNVENDYA